jgi:hypothetical protein
VVFGAALSGFAVFAESFFAASFTTAAAFRLIAPSCAPAGVAFPDESNSATTAANRILDMSITS